MSNPSHQYYVYMLTNWNNKVLYIGVTGNLSKRIEQHKSKTVDGFTKKYNVNKLVYYEVFREVKDAIKCEKVLKGWSREKKNRLVSSKNPEWMDLSLDDSL